MRRLGGFELPALTWVSGGVPWALDPDDSSKLLVPRVEGDTLIIDRYQAAPGQKWAGATESFV